ncbi:hypothetical protein [Algiphilus sp.]|uniref:hypothetical protein n=1 Tax=Algiphilus sp. TaxID=1872431 RepID=UPI003B522F44
MNQLVENEIKDLIKVGEKLVSDAAVSGDYLPHDRVQELVSITARGGQLITRLYGSESHYFEMFKASTSIPGFNEMHSNHYRHVSDVVGMFKAVAHDIETGMLRNFRSVVQAEIFADFLEMAEHLLNEGYKDASAVVLGAVLEDSLRKLADANGVPTAGSSGKPLTIDPLNAALAKGGMYGPLVQKQITSWANLRNDAAHGHFGNYDKAQVQQMLLFVQKFCADYLQ